MAVVFVHRPEILGEESHFKSCNIYINKVAVRKSSRMRSKVTTGARWDGMKIKGPAGLWPLLLSGPGPRGFDHKAAAVLLCVTYSNTVQSDRHIVTWDSLMPELCKLCCALSNKVQIIICVTCNASTVLPDLKSCE